jgi:hypothetical protein
MDRFYHGHAGSGAVGLSRHEGSMGLALLLAGQRLYCRLGGANIRSWFAAAASRIFGDELAGPQAQRIDGVDVATDEKGVGLLPRAREEREKRGLTYEQMGEVLGLSEQQVQSGAVQGYESGMPVRNGSVVRIYQELQRARLQACTWLGVPRFTLMRDGDSIVVHHNEFPRFIAKAMRGAMHKEQWRFAKAGMPVIPLRPETSLSQMVVSYIDHVPPGVPVGDVMTDAVLELERYLAGGN